MRTLTLFILVVSAITLSLPSLAADYGVTDLGSLPFVPYYGAQARANNAGQLVLRNGDQELLYTPESALTNLGIGIAYGINAAGEVPISRRDDSGAYHAFLYTPGNGVADLGIGPDSMSTCINDLGQVVGSFDAGGQHHTFLYTPGAGVTDLGLLGTDSYAAAVNNAGQVAGQFTASDGTRHAFVYTPDSGTADLGTLGADDLGVSAINATGAVTGGAFYASDHHDPRAFLYRPGSGVIDLGFPSWAYAINGVGQVVGWAPDATYAEHAFVYTPGAGTVDLGTLGGLLSIAYSISDSGRIVGISSDASGTAHVVAWDPVPEPSSLAALCVGLVPLMLRRRTPSSSK